MQGLAVTNELLFYVLTSAIRDPGVFLLCYKKLLPEHFLNENEQPFAIIWTTACEYYNRYNRIPGKFELESLIDSRLAQANDSFFSNAIKYYLSLMFDPSLVQVNKDLAIDFLNVIFDRYYKWKIQSDLSKLNGDDSAFRSLWTRLNEEYSRRATAIYPVWQDVKKDLSLLKEEIRGFLCGIPFIDSALKGHRGSEVYVLLGPTGSGKSLLSLQLCTQVALISEGSKDNGLIVYFSYELPRSEIIFRAISQISKVPAARLKEIIEKEEKNAKESPRIDAAIDLINKYLKLVDFSGLSGGSIFGMGGLDEVSNLLMELQDQTGRQIKLVVLDWAGALLRRFAAAQGLDLSRSMVSLLNSFVQEAHIKVASKFDTSVWVVHQIAGAVSDRPAHMPIHHSNAAWCKSFAEYAWFAMCLGPQDLASKVCLLNYSKLRRSEPIPPTKLKLSDCLTFIDVSDQYIIDNRVGFVEVGDL